MKQIIHIHDYRHQRAFNTLKYWANGVSKLLLPNQLFLSSRKRIMSSLDDNEMQIVHARASYYCQLPEMVAEPSMGNIGSFGIPIRRKHRFSRYVLDLNEVLCRFPNHLMFDYMFGDITEEAKVPSFVKSRPIPNGTTQSVIMKLDKLRHFRFVNDTRRFQDKKNMLVSRNFVTQPHRRRLLDMYFGHAMCDVGKINMEVNDPHPEWVKPFMPIDTQLEYKFIACIEGNDVATNLKWVMSSNSIAVMPKPRYETWYMEGLLQPGVHYIEVKPDYSDLIEKLEYYLMHPAECEEILIQAHAYVREFCNERLELATQIATAEKYFVATGQIAQL